MLRTCCERKGRPTDKGEEGAEDFRADDEEAEAAEGCWDVEEEEEEAGDAAEDC